MIDRSSAPIPFDLDWLEVPEFKPFTPVKPRFAPEDLILKLDLTTLQGDDTHDRISGLCQVARGPIQNRPEIQAAAVCIYPAFIGHANENLVGSAVKVATVAAGFPHGLSHLTSRIHEVAECQKLGADEIDVVIRRDLALEGKWLELYEELVHLRKVSGNCTLKVILATGELGCHEIIFKASMVALMAGADFIKTSSGKESVNATLEAGASMISAVCEFGEKSGQARGIKAAGGIRSYEQADAWQQLVYQNLGSEAISAARFRLGASTLIDDLRSRVKV